MLTQKRCVGERVFVSGYVSLYLWVCVCLRVCVCVSVCFLCVCVYSTCACTFIYTAEYVAGPLLSCASSILLARQGFDRNASADYACSPFPWRQGKHSIFILSAHKRTHTPAHTHTDTLKPTPKHTLFLVCRCTNAASYRLTQTLFGENKSNPMRVQARWSSIVFSSTRCHFVFMRPSIQNRGGRINIPLRFSLSPQRRVVNISLAS
jgi:hypothetical protein